MVRQLRRLKHLMYKSDDPSSIPNPIKEEKENRLHKLSSNLSTHTAVHTHNLNSIPRPHKRGRRK